MRRWWWKWGLVAVLAASITLLIAWQRGVFAHPYEFRVESARLLTLLGGGEEKATEAYETASLTFQESRLSTTFVDRAERLTATLGHFEKIESFDGVELHNSLRGKTARVEYELRFSSGIVTHGAISYLQDKSGAWLLLGYSIRVPMMLADKVESIDSQTKRLVAPAEVRELLKLILASTAKGAGDEIFDNASLPFRESSSKVQFQKMLAGVTKELGAFQHVLEFTKSDHNASKTRAKMTAILQYEKARTTGTFEFIKVENEGAWRLLRFKVLIPEPLIPGPLLPAQ